jgi:PEP-CTERM motif
MSVSSLLSQARVVCSSLLLLAALGLGVVSTPLWATSVSDDVGDFLSTFNGPHNGDLDVVSADFSFDGVNFTFRSTENGPIGTTPGSLFVWGIDRGLHNPFFGSFRDGVLFDVVVVLRPDLTGTVIDFSPDHAPSQDLPAGSVTKDGNTIQGVVPATMLPSEGLPFAEYQANIWPRTGLNALDNTQISDFGPDNSDLAVTTPEPATVLFLGTGLVVLGLSRRAKRLLVQRK